MSVDSVDVVDKVTAEVHNQFRYARKSSEMRKARQGWEPDGLREPAGYDSAASVVNDAILHNPSYPRQPPALGTV